jgi:Ca2+-transporting ATPase
MQLAVLCFPPLMLVFDTLPMDAAEWLCVLALAVAPGGGVRAGKRG